MVSAVTQNLLDWFDHHQNHEYVNVKPVTLVFLSMAMPLASLFI
jgi:hypothetical protein